MTSQLPLVKAENAAVKEDPAVSDLISAVKERLPSEASSQGYDRAKLRETAYKLALALETPGETFDRVAYYVRLPRQSFPVNGPTWKNDLMNKRLTYSISHYTLPLLELRSSRWTILDAESHLSRSPQMPYGIIKGILITME